MYSCNNKVIKSETVRPETQYRYEKIFEKISSLGVSDFNDIPFSLQSEYFECVAMIIKKDVMAGTKVYPCYKKNKDGSTTVKTDDSGNIVTYTNAGLVRGILKTSDAEFNSMEDIADILINDIISSCHFLFNIDDPEHSYHSVCLSAKNKLIDIARYTKRKYIKNAISINSTVETDGNYEMTVQIEDKNANFTERKSNAEIITDEAIGKIESLKYKPRMILPFIALLAGYKPNEVVADLNKTGYYLTLKVIIENLYEEKGIDLLPVLEKVVSAEVGDVKPHTYHVWTNKMRDRLRAYETDDSHTRKK